MIPYSEAVSAFADHLRKLGKQKATVESYARDARAFCEFLTEHRIERGDVSPETLLQWQEHLRHECAGRENSIRRHVIGVRQFFRFLAGESTASPLDMAWVPPRDESLGRQLSGAEIERLISAAADERPELKGARDAALVALLALEGVKASEIITLVWTDFALAGGRALLHVPGPRGRTLALDPSTAQRLATYKQVWQKVVLPSLSAGGDARMFVAFKGREGGPALPAMTRHGLKFIIYELGEKIGIVGLNSEMLRHHAMSFQIEQGKSPEEIMEHLGLRRLGNIAKHLALDSVAERPSASG